MGPRADACDGLFHPRCIHRISTRNEAGNGFAIPCNDNFFPALEPGKDIFGQRRVEIVRYRYLSRQQAQAALSAPSRAKWNQFGNWLSSLRNDDFCPGGRLFHQP